MFAEHQHRPALLRPDPALARIKLFCTDVDGVLTDGGLYYDEKGSELRRYNVLDGMGLKRLQAIGVRVCIITQSATGAITSRGERLGVDYCFTGVDDKLPRYRQLLDELALTPDETSHIGDDVNDLELLQAVGVAVTVPAATAPVLRACRFITAKGGGNGAVREFAEAILESRLRWPVA